MRAKILAVALLCVAGTTADAQTFLNPVTPLINGAPAFTVGNPGNITGSFSATLSGFAPAGTFASLTSAGTSGSVALPAGTVVAFQNTGTTTVSCTLGIGSATALANELQVPASSTVFVTVGSNTFGACIDQTGSTSNTVVLAGGTGLGTGFGGGGGSGGGGGTVAQGNAGSNAQAWWMQIGDTTNGPAAIVTAGANGASNTASGLLSYGRNLVFNGTTWDRWTGAVTLASLPLPSGAATSALQTTINTTLGTPMQQTGGSVAPSTLAAWGLVASTQNGATPTNGQLAMGQFNTTPTTITSGNVSPFQMDNAGNLLVNVKAGGAGGGAVFGPTAVGSANANPPVVIGGTVTGAAGQNVGGVAVKPASTTALATDQSMVVQESPNSPLITAINAAGAISQATPGTTNGVAIVGVNGATALAGAGATGTGSPRTTQAQDATTVAGSAPVKGGIAVVNGGSFYEAVAASQTATVLQSSAGAAGDYLSHCTIYPTSTSPGVVTVFDNTNTAANSAVLFPGGASSLSNLAPFAVPVGANSVNGAWKVTTGANVSVVCYGKFS